MNVEIVCIGTELLTGKLNTNSAYIGEKLASIGLDPELVTTVGDDLLELQQVFREAIKRSDIIIVTGGLGPTFDDLTRQALGKVLDRTLTLNRDILADIAKFFIERGVEMPKNNELQAYIIDGAKPLLNKAGTAPGQMIEIAKSKDKSTKTLIVLLPGPPKEMQIMFDGQVFSYLKSFETRIKKRFTLHICGFSESAVDEKIRPIVEGERALESDCVDFTILAHQMIIDIKASVLGKDEMLVDETLRTLKHEFYEVLGDNIYGEDKETLESAIGRLLSKKRKTLAIAESCTGGLVAHRITNVSGSSLYFKESFVTYSNESKVKRLGVDPEALEKYGAVSEQVALQMAEGAKKTAQADYAISLTGIAGPTGGTAEKPVGLVFLGICIPGSATAVHRFQLSGNRIEIRERAANLALDLLRRELI